jgi:hypothetical protein
MNESKWFLKFINDDNVSIYKDSEEQLNLNIQSYDYNTLDDIQKTKRYFNRIKKYKQDILNYYNVDTFIISIDNFNIDGLYESNSLLLDNSILYCNY